MFTLIFKGRTPKNIYIFPSWGLPAVQENDGSAKSVRSFVEGPDWHVATSLWNVNRCCHLSTPYNNTHTCQPQLPFQVSLTWTPQKPCTKLFIRLNPKKKKVGKYWICHIYYYFLNIIYILKSEIKKFILFCGFSNSTTVLPC